MCMEDILQILKDERLVKFMSIKIYDAEYYDIDYDNCGQETKMILEINGIKIPLCDNCLADLHEAITEYELSKF